MKNSLKHLVVNKALSVNTVVWPIRTFSSTTTGTGNHTKFGFRARAALARHLFQTFSFRLAEVNPLRVDGFMAVCGKDYKLLEDTLPHILRPLVAPLVIMRQQRKQGEDAHFITPSYLNGLEEENMLKTLVTQYCDHGIGYEFMHCATEQERHFFIDEIESTSSAKNEDDIASICFEQVYRAAEWEKLLERRYPTCKRFSLEGLESTVLAVNGIIDSFATYAPVETFSVRPRVVMSCLHRGRINMIHNVLQLPAWHLLKQWDETEGPTYDDITLGRSSDIVTWSGKMTHLALIPTPAHLESQDGALNGKAYGHIKSLALTSKVDELLSEKEKFDQASRCVLPVVLHGDASFCGQGIVSETLQLSTYSDFHCGGTIHLILNNQVGFTGETQHMRSQSQQFVGVSDVSLGIRAPILHVNAERPRDVYRAACLAERYRRCFAKDIVLELWGFRKHGHNEVDEPTITNVNLYKEVGKHKSCAEVYKDTLQGPVGAQVEHVQQQIKDEYYFGKHGKSIEEHCAGTVEKKEWDELLSNADLCVNYPSNTGVEIDKVKKALDQMASVPEGFTLHPLAERAVTRRKELLRSFDSSDTLATAKIDWSTAELLALSSMANEGHYVRLSGQDSQRGTFGQRHAVLHDCKNGNTHSNVPSLLHVVNSPLSELGVLGFEHGVSLASPNFLVLFEAQFGDFVNNGQVLIDTMIASEKEKFGLDSNLVLLLPHGYDGMGPEHSSCRLERFLSLHTDTPEGHLCDRDELDALKRSNFLVVYPSTPSNYFHVLRRTFTWPFRRPMVIPTPKRTLRLQQASSLLTEVIHGLPEKRCIFSEVLDDPRSLEKDKVKTVVLCSGEIFYDLFACIESMPAPVSTSVALIRIEQLAPFPMKHLETVLRGYSRVRRAAWIQEEPSNMGALGFVSQFLDELDVNVEKPIARPVSAAPAVGHPRLHKESQRALMEEFLVWMKQQPIL